MIYLDNDQYILRQFCVIICDYKDLVFSEKNKLYYNIFLCFKKMRMYLYNFLYLQDGFGRVYKKLVRVVIFGEGSWWLEG